MTTAEAPTAERPVVGLAVDERGVASLRLQRPECGNAYDGDLLRSWHAALDDLECVEDLRVVVLSGEGRHFQAGADLDWVARVRESSVEENAAASALTATAVERLEALPVPVICLVQGSCFGGGTGLAAAADVVVAAEGATFSVAEVRWGLEPSIVLPQLTRAMSGRHLRRYAVTGETFDAVEAVRTGLVHEVVDGGELARRSEELVVEVLRCAPGAVRHTKGHLTRAHLRDDLLRAHILARTSSEAAEGLAAFASRRPPAWSQSGYRATRHLSPRHQPSTKEEN
ncbi:enoyl-CoA hydratase-related protein [Knoellia locipacati]|uniref:enoyl-CoA hydratase-related protein n=1 Tax=Knoellia locipacati TaxID=882824 RepID=UPI00384CE38D